MLGLTYIYSRAGVLDSKVATNQGNDVQFLFSVLRVSRRATGSIFFALRIRRGGTQMKMANVLNFLAYFSALQGASNQEAAPQAALAIVVASPLCAALETRVTTPLGALLCHRSSYVLYANKVQGPPPPQEGEQKAGATWWLLTTFWSGWVGLLAVIAHATPRGSGCPSPKSLPPACNNNFLLLFRPAVP